MVHADVHEGPWFPVHHRDQDLSPEQIRGGGSSRRDVADRDQWFSHRSPPSLRKQASGSVITSRGSWRAPRYRRTSSPSRTRCGPATSTMPLTGDPTAILQTALAT